MSVSGFTGLSHQRCCEHQGQVFVAEIEDELFLEHYFETGLDSTGRRAEPVSQLRFRPGHIEEFQDLIFAGKVVSTYSIG